jgi:signal transduction histidine kinase
MMKKSIKWKLFMVLTAVIVFMVAIFGVLNTLVLERYYFLQKTRLLIGIWDKVNRFYQDRQKDVELELEKLSANNGITLFIADSEFNVIYRSANRAVILFRPLYSGDPDLQARQAIPAEPDTQARQISPGDSDSQVRQISPGDSDSQARQAIPGEPRSQTRQASPGESYSQVTAPGGAPPEGEGLDASVDPMTVSAARLLSNRYLVERRHDERLNFEYLQLAGRLDNQYYLFAQIAVDPIRESVLISNRFLMIAALITLIIGAGMILLVSRSFTQPILTLSSIARRMALLDFTQRYEGSGEDELNTLGQSINTMSRQLEQKIAELQKTNQQLQLEIDYISQIDETRKEFISGLSHELKTPLALIQGYAEGLRDNVIQDEENKIFYCDVILDEAEKTGALVKKLLNLIQMEFGSNELVIQSFDMTRLIWRLLKKNKVLFDSKGVRARFDHGASAYLWADEYAIEEVLNNYLTNAVNHAAGEKEIRIWTELRPDRDAAGSRLRVSVFNTGAPILEQDMLKIWDSFYKADKARTREYGGNGLGLAVVKAAVLRHHGLCGVDNVEGGVVFWFELDTEKWKSSAGEDTGEDGGDDAAEDAEDAGDEAAM